MVLVSVFRSNTKIPSSTELAATFYQNKCAISSFMKMAIHDAGSSFVLTEVLLDPCRTWCPSSTCQAVCQLKESDSPTLPQLVQCAVCALEFCSACKANWHPGQACQENNLPITSFLPGENRYHSLCLFTYLLHPVWSSCSLKFSQLLFLDQIICCFSFFFVLYDSYTLVTAFIYASLLFKHLMETKLWCDGQLSREKS